MTIRRHALRQTDFAVISSGKRLAPVHPGDVLLTDFIEPMGISRYRVAKNINVSQRRIVAERAAGKEIARAVVPLAA